MPEKKKHPGGRPSIYTDELAGKICVRLAEGESLRSICSDDDMPAKSTVLLWVVTPGHKFSDQYMCAREAAGYSHADTITDLADEVQKVDGLDANRARVAMIGYQWAAERMAPKAHNQKVSHDHGGSINIHLTTDEQSLL